MASAHLTDTKCHRIALRMLYYIETISVDARSMEVVVALKVLTHRTAPRQAPNFITVSHANVLTIQHKLQQTPTTTN
jgi:hypothetical protein